MKKLKIYLDTSVINFLFADDAPEKKEVTIDFFENYINEYEVYISDLVIREIEKTNDENKRKILLEVIVNYNLEIYSNLPSALNEIAAIYIQR